METVIAALVASMALLAISESAEAAKMKCGSSWEICAQRGKGPGRVKASSSPAASRLSSSGVKTPGAAGNGCDFLEHAGIVEGRAQETTRRPGTADPKTTPR
jgi:hypothetical protein